MERNKSLQIVSLPGGQSKIVQEKLNELRVELRSGGASAEDKLLYAEALFGRAPDDFLKRCSKESLLDIATEVSALSKKFISEDPQFITEVKNPASDSDRGTYTSVFVITHDRPFIIDSIVELLRGRGIKHHVLLHPILKSQAGQFISTSYIELDRLESEKERSELKMALAYVIGDVARVTTDFEPIVSKVRLARDWIKLLPGDPLEEDVEKAEVGDFLQWLIDERFVFLGYREWREIKGKLAKQDTELGLFLSTNPELKRSLEDVIRDAEHLVSTDGYFQFSKLNTLSPVHRRGKLDLVTVRTVMNGETVVQSFLGQLTSRAVAQEAATIPLIRRKIVSVLQQEGFLPNSHDYKELVSLIGTLPKGDLLQLSKDAVRQDLQVMMGIQRRNETKVILREHSLKRFSAISIFMPRDRFSSGALQRIQRFLKRTFVGYDPASGYYISGNEDELVALYFLIPAQNIKGVPASDEEIERNISELSLSWEEKLDLLLSRERGRERGIQLSSLYNEIFPDGYKASTSHRETLIDIQFLECLNKDNNLVIDLRTNPKVDGEHLLKIYKRGGQLSLSELLPYLENVGFHVLNETVTKLSRQGDLESMWGAIHTLSVKSPYTISESVISHVLLPGLKALISNEAENDRLNGLLIASGIKIREIALLRTMGHFLWQLKEISSEATLENALLTSPNLAKLLVEAFQIKFRNGGESVATRHSKLSENRDNYFQELSRVSTLAYDRALRALYNVVESTVRTNFFRSEDLRISIKLDCSKIARMPEPRPLFEVFVCAPHFEGVHLRGGKVARGGIRWSERPDDFRTEVFGLMKTQMMKNAIIVPVGAKGGFVVKGKISKEEVVRCYKDYIRSLLEITDNLIGGEISPPENVIRLDGDDPYFVVAADKGTAAFSDIANKIAVEEFNFWLGDAFASGGSQGYSHKSFGITARGVWETTKRHFRELGYDIDRNPFTVVGVGDMSGDVFGNGLLLSDNAKLVAAFDHRHIFIDPNPEEKSSFAERKRLFDLPTSSWMDYNQSLLSAGGGIYERSQKEIRLSDEARAALGIKESVLSGIELMRAILRAPVDLFWNGGIGTYVKASSEHNVSVGDRANDDVRVDAVELRAKIVAEGGNLGFTQSARVEYSAKGGKINTDAVDNSGGVNLSDLEVNIKILFAVAIQRGRLSREERNALLNEVADEVCLSVLRRNARQAEAISAGCIRSKSNLTYFRGLISQYEGDKYLDRRQDILPDEETLLERSKSKLGILRPELAILLACNKMKITEVVIDSAIPEDPGMERLLFDYFPKRLRELFPDEIRSHPLKREIIAAQVANILGERLGVTFLYRVVEELGASEEAIITSFLAAEYLVRGDELADELAQYDSPVAAKRYLAAVTKISVALDNVTRWILQGGITGAKFGAIQEVARKYSAKYHELKSKTHESLPASEIKFIRELEEKFASSGFPEELTKEISALQFATANLDLCQLSEDERASSDLLLSLYSSIAEDLKVRLLLELVAKVNVSEHWDITAQRTLGSAIRSTPGLVVQEVMSLPGETAEQKLTHFRTKHEKGLRHYLDHLKDAEGKPLSISALLVLSNQLSGFWKET